MKSSYPYKCEYCSGTVRERLVEREAFKAKCGFVILENLTIGICDKCGNRYYSAAILRQVQQIAAGKISPDRRDPIPVSHAHRSR
jgi:YgiT-type zinc finger domain-containing protein